MVLLVETQAMGDNLMCKKLMCNNLGRRKRFDISGVKTVAFM